MNAETQRHRGRKCGGRQKRQTGWKRKIISVRSLSRQKKFQIKGASVLQIILLGGRPAVEEIHCLYYIAIYSK
jgi:hypothetical protein